MWGGKRWEKGEGRKGEGEIGRGRGGGGGRKGGRRENGGGRTAEGERRREKGGGRKAEAKERRETAKGKRRRENGGGTTGESEAYAGGPYVRAAPFTPQIHLRARSLFARLREGRGVVRCEGAKHVARKVDRGECDHLPAHAAKVKYLICLLQPTSL